MSKEFSQFPFGVPLADTDRFLIGRPDGASPSGFSNYIMTWAEIRAAVGVGPAGRDGSTIPGIDGEDAEEPMMVPGTPGTTGANGITTTNTTVFFLESESPEDVFPIPGERGLNGTNGTDGTIGRDGNTILLEPDVPDEPMMIQPPPGASGGGYNLVEDEATPQVARTTLNFVGAGVTASDVGGKTEINIPGGAGGDLALNKHVLTSNFTITAGWAAYITRYLEIAAGITLEIGLDGDLEIG